MAASETPTLVSDQKTVATAGTAVALSSASVRVRSVTLIAKVANTGKIYVGGSGVSSTVNGGLDPGDALEVPAVNWLDLKDIFINSSVNGEGVDFYAVKA